jgi:Zn-dependent M28 family amino/carboxypeptidase
VKLAALLACATVACGGGGGDDAMNGPDGGTSGGDGSLAMPDAPPGCSRPGLDQPWLAGLVAGAVTQLASAPRYTVTQRQAARTYLQDQLTQIGWSPQLQTYSTGANVYANIPATTSGATKQIIVGAHYDTVSGSPGANDNATGCAAVLALARYLHDMTCRKVNVTVVFFDEEEVGLVGARAYAAMLTVSNVQAVHTIDQVGWDSDNDTRFELELPTTTLETEYRTAAQTVGVPVTKTTTQGTDHEAFRDRGMPAIGITEEYVGNDTSPYRHTAQDTASTVEQSYLQLGAKLLATGVMNEL